MFRMVHLQFEQSDEETVRDLVKIIATTAAYMVDNLLVQTENIDMRGVLEDLPSWENPDGTQSPAIEVQANG